MQVHLQKGARPIRRKLAEVKAAHGATREWWRLRVRIPLGLQIGLFPIGRASVIRVRS